MSFWQLASGEAHDLDPDPDPSMGEILLPKIFMFPVAIASTAALVAAAGTVSPYTWGFFQVTKYAWRMAMPGLNSLGEAVSELQSKKSQAAIRKLRQAITHYERNLRYDPTNVSVLLNKGKSHLALGENEIALRCWETAAEQIPPSFEPYFLAGSLLLAIGQTEEGVKRLTYAASLNPAQQELWCTLSVAFRSQGKLQEALDAANRALKINDNLGSAWFNKAQLHFDLGSKTDAINCWIKAAEIDPSLTPPWAEMTKTAELEFAKGEIEPSRKLLQEALSLYGEYVPAIYSLGVIEQHLGNLGLALARFEDVIKRKPVHALSWFNQGNVLMNLGQRDEALKCWRRAFDLQPKLRVPWRLEFEQAERLVEEGRIHEALAALGRALSQHENYAEAWLKKGLLLKTVNRPDEAVICFQRATELDSTLTLAWFNLGTSLYTEGRVAEGLTALERCVKSDETYPPGWMYLAAACADAGKLERAIEGFRKAKTLGVSGADKALELAQCYFAMDPTQGPARSR